MKLIKKFFNYKFKNLTLILAEISGQLKCSFQKNINTISIIHFFALIEDQCIYYKYKGDISISKGFCAIRQYVSFRD